MATTEIEAQDPQESGGPLARFWRAAGTVSSSWNRFWRLVGIYMPKRLYARSLLIVITPMILLQSVVTLVFMERHWQTVTQRLSTATTRDLAAIIDMIETYPNDDDYSNVIRIAQERLSMKIDILPPDPLPPPGRKPFFSILDQILSAEITEQINRPFWIDTVGDFKRARSPHPAGGQGAARLHPPQPGLCVQHAHLPRLDGRHLARAPDDRDPLPAQPDQDRS